LQRVHAALPGTTTSGKMMNKRERMISRQPQAIAGSKAAKEPLPRLPFECIALVLQGGGALGSYQAGVYQALNEVGLHPDWVAGISIGAINAALIAGNPPETRVEKLRRFWELVTVDKLWSLSSRASSSMMWSRELQALVAMEGDVIRGIRGRLSAALATVSGVPGFFTPRFPSPWLYPTGSRGATSFYDTRSLKSTLEALVDFDRINAGAMRFSVGAVNVRSGNFVYFDTATHTIRPEHVMASGALPPGFEAIEIDGEHYWDGGVVSNTPLQWVVDSKPRQDTLAFQVDLWNARGELPGNIGQVETRRKEIQYSSRTRAGTNSFKYAQRMRNTIATLLDNLTEEQKKSPEATMLRTLADRKVYNIVHLINRARNYENQSKDYEFSRASMEAHWRDGYNDTVRTLRHPGVLESPTNYEGVSTFDLEIDGRE
jgi:NTE family protein